jgi:hypothetical protein
MQPTNSLVYLDLGGALAAFGLIFAVYQLRKPEWDLILRIRHRWQRNFFWILGSMGLLLTLVGVLISECSFNCFPFPLDNPLTYEISAYVFFIASPLSLLYFSTRPKGLFEEKTAENFYLVMVQEISKTTDASTNAALEVLLNNFDNICAAAQCGNNQPKTSQYAREILDVILSDKTVVKILTTKRLDALQFVLLSVEKHKINRHICSIGIPKIVQNLFYDKDSFLYNHLEQGGLALSYSIYDSIFDSPVILSNYDLFEYPTLDFKMRKTLDVSGIEVFIEALSRAIITYLKTGDVNPRYINNGLYYLSNIFGDLCHRIATEEKQGVNVQYSMKDEFWALHVIAHFLGHNYVFLAYREELNQLVVEKEKSTLKADFNSEITINAGVAAALYKAFEQLSYLEKSTDTYQYVLDLIHGMVHVYEYKVGYREPFEKRMWEQIATNVIKRHYPAALRTYLKFIGYHAACGEKPREGWLAGQVERMTRLLYVDLKPLLEKDAKMINKEKMEDALLPMFIKYQDGIYTYTFGFGEGEEREIPAPQEGSSSALEGINFDDLYLV